jgi:PAS domain S-box-containing protein
VTNILFLCGRNDARSPMAAGFAKVRARGGEVSIHSAGYEKAAIHPLAIRAMAEVGIDITAHRPVDVTELGADAWDVVIDMSDGRAPAVLLPGRPEWVNWNLPDPDAIKGDEDTVYRAFRDVRDRIRTLVDDFFDKGYYCAFIGSRARTQSILNSISDAVIVMDEGGRILSFNKAAETLTGYMAHEALNQGCDMLFPDRICHTFCHEAEEAAHPRKVEVVMQGGERRLVLARAAPVLDAGGVRTGTFLSLQDVRRRHGASLVDESSRYSGIIGRDEKMLEVFELIRELADAHVPVLVEGESGTGKELVAAAIHNEGPRAAAHFVPVNCGALPESLLESELFGHVKGAFTGAIRDKKGRFELADGGTIFLDEIGDISPAMQVKLLRVLQEGTFERVGSEQTLKVSVRIISATNKNLAREIAAGRFREDLFYRLSVVPIQLPPLRERRGDIPLLVEFLLSQITTEAGRQPMRVSAAAMDILMAQPWPGNVRELHNWLQFALVKSKGGEEVLPEYLPLARRPLSGGPAPEPVADAFRKRKLTENTVREALRNAGGNKLEAARLLEVSRATLYRFLEDSGIAL